MYGKKEMIRDIVGGIFLFGMLIAIVVLGFCVTGYEL